MTYGKAVGRLMAAAPQLRDYMRTPSYCVMATAIGCDVLRAFGIAARPVSAHLDFRASLDGEILTSTRQGVVLNPVPSPWDGHLLVSTDHDYLDLCCGQFTRPARGIVTTPTMRYGDGRHPLVQVALVRGFMWMEARPEDLSYQDSPDWSDVRKRQPLVKAVVRAIRRGPRHQ